MSQPSREEIDAKLQAVEARMDARVAEVTGKIDSLMVKLDSRDTLYQTQFSHMNQKLEALAGLRTVIITTGLATGLGVVGLVLAMMTGMVSTFDSGRETAQLAASAEKSANAAEAAARSVSTEEILKAFNLAMAQTSQEKATPPPPEASTSRSRDTPDGK